MPKYKLILTVQDSFGMTKEIEAGTVDAAEYELTETELKNIEKALPLENYIKKEELPDELVTDAEVENAITFTTDKFVTKSYGDFEVGDSVKGLTISTVLAKLLGLVDYMPQHPSGGTLPDNPEPEQPDDPERPDEPEVPSGEATLEEIIEYLIATETVMYSQDAEGNLIEAPFAVNEWTASEATVKMDGVSTIYTITDEAGKVMEAGYQEATVYTEEDWLTVALSSKINNVKVKMYDPDAGDWVEMNWKVVKAAEQTIPDYTIWTVPEEYEILSGDTYRFVILD